MVREPAIGRSPCESGPARLRGADGERSRGAMISRGAAGRSSSTRCWRRSAAGSRRGALPASGDASRRPDGPTVVVVWDGHGVANDGTPYDNSYAWIMTLADGLVVDGTAFYDSISFDELWTRVEA